MYYAIIHRLLTCGLTQIILANNKTTKYIQMTYTLTNYISNNISYIIFYKFPNIPFNLHNYMIKNINELLSQNFNFHRIQMTQYREFFYFLI